MADAVKFEYTIRPTSTIIDNDNNFNDESGTCSVLSGGWPTNTTLVDSWKDGSGCQTHAAVGTGVIRWTPTIAFRGYYSVYAWWPTANSTFSAAAPYRIVGSAGPPGDTRWMDQQQQVNSGKWNYLGTYLFDAGTSGYVELTGTPDGKVMADAIKFIAEGD